MTKPLEEKLLCIHNLTDTRFQVCAKIDLFVVVVIVVVFFCLLF